MLETGKSAAEVARDLGVHEGTLQTWVSRARGAVAAGTGPLEESEREELARLRSENQRFEAPRTLRTVVPLRWVCSEREVGCRRNVGSSLPSIGKRP
ncbi:transposase [Streptomyces sp. MS2.AVA.5]|uniref:Transposase n=1 Tax=Streptomyces achmelvichensis TaxID=3134111 RepID=A0ACC6PLR2_9ACTN